MKTYLVTGASSGFGLALCKDLLKSRNKIVAIARDKEKFFASLNQEFDTDLVNFFSLDLSKVEEIEAFFYNEIKNRFQFDGFIHCAGIEETLPLTLYKPERIEEIFKINVFSTVELLRLFSKKIFSNDGASVVLFSSVMGILGQPGKIGYCSTKAAVLGIVKAGALELAKRNFTINAILPGVVDTPMTQKLFSTLDEAQIENIIKMHPLGIGKVENIVSAINFLISPENEWMTGQSLIIDGGYSIQ